MVKKKNKKRSYNVISILKNKVDNPVTTDETRLDILLLFQKIRDKNHLLDIKEFSDEVRRLLDAD